MVDREALRESYRPDRVTDMFVLESRPDKDANFFYLETTGVYHEIKRVFETVTGRPFSLEQFKSLGFWLDDLVTEVPVDKLGDRDRRKRCESAIPELVERLRLLQPERVYIGLKRIEKYVRQAVESSGIECEVYALPFAGFGRQARFRAEFEPLLRDALRSRT